MNAVSRLWCALAMLIPSPLHPRRAAAELRDPVVLPHCLPRNGDPPPTDSVFEAYRRACAAADRAEAAVAQLERQNARRTIARDLEEEARWRAEQERDERLGSHADWPDL